MHLFIFIVLVLSQDGRSSKDSIQVRILIILLVLVTGQDSQGDIDSIQVRTTIGTGTVRGEKSVWYPSSVYVSVRLASLDTCTILYYGEL